MSNDTIMEDAAGNGASMEGQVIEEPDSGTITAGQVIDVPNSEISGLLATAQLYVRPIFSLWLKVKSTAVLSPFLY